MTWRGTPYPYPGGEGRNNRDRRLAVHEIAETMLFAEPTCAWPEVIKERSM